MEPRPQSSRPAQDPSQQRRSQPPYSGGVGDTGSFQQPNPATAAAPPRADYDYSPLDLAPPGQRRRRQLVAAVLGGLVVLMLVSGIVFAFLLLRDDDPEETDTLAASQTEVADLEATLRAQEQETIVAVVAGTETPEGNESGGTTTEGSTQAREETVAEPSTGDAADPAAAPTPTPPAQNQDAAASGALTEEQLFALLPDASVMPQGLEATGDTTRTEADVVDALGGTRDAETRLDNWGWAGNVERSFMAPDPAALAPDATTNIVVSLHGFASDQAAAEALTFYSDIVAASGGYQETDAGDIGATNRLLVRTQEGGGSDAALYVQQGSVLYRIGGFSPGGDPTINVLNVASQVVGQ